MAASCRHPGCPTLLPSPGWCDRHAAEAAEASRLTDARRDPEARRIYASKRWHRVRRRILDRDPICRLCRKAFAEHAHHVQKIKDRPDLAYDEDNLVGVCGPCHPAAERVPAAQWGNPSETFVASRR